ncbi:hypothetical protein BH10PLA1_BH10PLA1_10610 [soil metagenome]
MSKTMFKRFSRFHRVLHWLVALPYLVLMVSGAMILLRHLGWSNAPDAFSLEKLHTWTGIAFIAIVVQSLFAAVVGGYWRLLQHDFISWLMIRPRDVLWLMIVPLNTFFPKRFPLPRAGRFNGGQKLHGAFILFAVTGFIITGLVMMLIPGWLTVWRIHVVIFCGAVAFLSLHLFLGLINPSTRQALGGIFTGNVSHHYVAQHHALELTEPVGEHAPHAVVSIKAVVIVLAAIVILASLWWRGPGHSILAATAAGPWQTTLLLPGAITAVHAKAIQAGTCVACHVDSGPVTTASCLKCHAEIQSSLLNKAGFHGTLTANCVTCHTEHHGADADLRPLDSRAFNHNQARFALNGAHRSLDCDKCHLEHSPTPGLTRFIGLTFARCTDCHANPHTDMPSADCRKCHTEQSWAGRNLLFVHNRDATFKLDAIHSALACVACHKQTEKLLVFRGTPTACAQCHTGEAEAMAGKIGSLVLSADPHHGRVSCIDCHKTAQRTQTPAQYAAECVRCHGEPYRSVFFNWQKALDENEQAARARLQALAGKDQQAKNQWSDVLSHAHAAGMHNTQGAEDAFEKVGK